MRRASAGGLDKIAEAPIEDPHPALPQQAGIRPTLEPAGLPDAVRRRYLDRVQGLPERELARDDLSVRLCLGE